MTEENKIGHLWNTASRLKPLNNAKKLLKSYYLTISRKVARYNFILPKEKYDNVEMCEKCSSCWFDGNFTMKLISAKIRSSKAKRLVEDLESGKKLTKKQKNRAKWYRKKIFSILQFNCKLCQHKTNVRLIKPHKDDKSKDIEEEAIIPVHKQKNKKKKKDKFAGLKIEKLLNKSELQKTNTETTEPTKKIHNSECDFQSTKTSNKIINIISKVQSIKKATIPSNILPQKNQLNKKKIESKSINIKKLKNKKSNITKTHVVSKTQQKNTILQLAQMLKEQNVNNQNNNNKSENRLKNLLR